MRSSTSSSDAAWLKGGVAAIALFSSSLLAVELGGRRSGFVPTLDVFDRQHWADERRRVASLGPRGVVFLGRSEMVRATSLEVWRKEMPDHEFVQLSVIGRRPGAAIQDVTHEPGFSGVIICAVTEDSAFWTPDQQPWVDYYHQSWNWNQRLDWAIKKRLALSLISYPNQFDPLFHARSLIETGSWEPPRYRVFSGDRSHFIDWTLRAWQRLLPKRRADFRRYLRWLSSLPQAAAPPWSQMALEATDTAVRDFQARGGRFVFLRLPVLAFPDEPALAAVLAQHKRSRWDPFAAQTQAVAIHSSDEPELGSFRPRDGQHLDHLEARDFTRGLIDVLRRRGVLR